MTARLDLGLLTYSAKPRGSVVHAAQLAEALCARGHDVTLYALDKDGQGFYRPLRCPFVGIPAAPAPADTQQLVAQRIAEVAAFATRGGLRHRLLHAQDCLVASGLLAARAALGRATIRRTVHHVERFESAYLEHCQQRSIAEADLCLTVSRATRAAVARAYGRDCQIVGNGVDLERFLQTPVAAGALLRARLGIAPCAPLVVSIGGVEPRKNSDRMLTAFLQARAVRPDLRWVIAGGASIFEHAAYRAAFSERLTKLDQASRDAIVQVGVISEAELAALLRAADVLMHASLHEGFGLAVMEAMASDARVVVSRGEPFDEFVDDGCAVRVRADDHEEISRGLLVALHDDAAARARARARCEAHTWSRCAERHELAYAVTGDRAV